MRERRKGERRGRGEGEFRRDLSSPIIRRKVKSPSRKFQENKFFVLAPFYKGVKRGKKRDAGRRMNAGVGHPNLLGKEPKGVLYYKKGCKYGRAVGPLILPGAQTNGQGLYSSYFNLGKEGRVSRVLVL